jgi:hypothetical protein
MMVYMELYHDNTQMCIDKFTHKIKWETSEKKKT